MGQGTAWTEAADNIIIESVVKAQHNSISNEAAFLAASEVLFDLEGVERTQKAVGMRYYTLRRTGKVSPLLFAPNTADDSSESDAMDLAGMFVEMRKIIKERDDFKSKYEDALNYKIQYEEIKKKLAKIEKESAAFMNMLRESKRA